MRIRITEYLDIDLEAGQWLCNRCGRALGTADDNYKKGCLILDRDPEELYAPLIQGTYRFSPDPEWIRIVEFYCPGCGTMLENEFLPPGHPITHDIELDLTELRKGRACSQAHHEP